MAHEIERKFRVKDPSWRFHVTTQQVIKQGYLGSVERCSIRVRISDERAFLNIKGATLGVVRKEYEYEIPLADAEELLADFCRKPILEKIRHHVPHAGHLWEIDVFGGDNEGLIVAEIELSDVDEPFELPPWAGEEVSHDRRYYNVCLIDHPYKNWGSETP